MINNNNKINNNDCFDALLRSRREQDDKLRNLSDGTYYKDNIFFQNYPDALQIQIHFDEFESVNPLGSKTMIHKIGAIYFSSLNLPPFLNSSLSNIHLLALFHSLDLKSIGFNAILEPIVQEIRILESEGITFNNRKYHGTVVSLCHDNLEGNQFIRYGRIFLGEIFLSTMFGS